MRRLAQEGPKKTSQEVPQVGWTPGIHYLEAECEPQGTMGYERSCAKGEVTLIQECEFAERILSLHCITK